jgi:hypothetical protein
VLVLVALLVVLVLVMSHLQMIMSQPVKRTVSDNSNSLFAGVWSGRAGWGTSCVL